MITKNNKTIDQIQMVSIEQLVPQDHILRKIHAAIDFDFIYDLVEERYCADNGRPSIGRSNKDRSYSIYVWNKKYASDN